MEKKYIAEEYVIIAVFLILILSIGCVCIYFYYVNLNQTITYFSCDEGECSTNIFNGEKQCPINGKIPYDPSVEVCNSRFTCESNLTPYALRSNGSTNALGLCEPGNICRCLRTARCATNITVTFKSSDGILEQIPLNIQGNDGSEFFEITDPLSTFCAIKANNLYKISPGACNFLDPDNITTSEIVNCMRSNPCLVGILAFNPLNTDNFIFNQNTIYNIPVSCIASKGPLKNYCPLNSVPVWNNKTGVIECKTSNGSIVEPNSLPPATQPVITQPINSNTQPIITQPVNSNTQPVITNTSSIFDQFFNF